MPLRFCVGGRSNIYTYGELIDGAGGLDVLQGGLEISELRLDLGGGELGTLKLYKTVKKQYKRGLPVSGSFWFL